MPEMLTTEAMDFLKKDTEGFALVARSMGIAPDTLVTLIRKKSKSLNTYSGVRIIAERMNKKPEEIIESGQIND